MVPIDFILIDLMQDCDLAVVKAELAADPIQGLSIGHVVHCSAGDVFGQSGILLLGDVVGILVGLPLMLSRQFLLQALDFHVAAGELGGLVTLCFEGGHIDLALAAVEVYAGPLNSLVLYQRGVEADALLKFLDHHNRLPPLKRFRLYLITWR